jgi:hypothetical protein
MRDTLPINLKTLVRAAPETLAANVDNVTFSRVSSVYVI